MPNRFGLIRVDVTSVQILAVQTERPGDQGRRTSKEPLRAGENFNRWITKSWKTLIEH
jgi:hypothetical protein